MVLNSFNRVEEVLHIVFKSYLRISVTSLVKVLINYVSLLHTHTHTHVPWIISCMLSHRNFKPKQSRSYEKGKKSISNLWKLNLRHLVLEILLQTTVVQVNSHFNIESSTLVYLCSLLCLAKRMLPISILLSIN